MARLTSRPDKATRYGGELPLGADPVTTGVWSLPSHVLAFSHGRAALSWFCSWRGPFRTALVCAYTCPTVPRLLSGLGIDVHLFDVWGSDIEQRLRLLPSPCLVLVPAMFGLPPWLEAGALARRCGSTARFVVDAAQTAFAALDWPVPPGGAVLSCPRKATSLGDGALLAVDGAHDIDAGPMLLPPLEALVAAKQTARAIFATGERTREAEALNLVRHVEDSWPDQPHAMSQQTLRALLELDRTAHRQRRRANAERLCLCLGHAVEALLPNPLPDDCVPFHWPFLHPDADDLVRRLHARRIYATRLWSDLRPVRDAQPHAVRLVRELVALPVDQRYTPDDMDALAGLVRLCL